VIHFRPRSGGVKRWLVTVSVDCGTAAANSSRVARLRPRLRCYGSPPFSNLLFDHVLSSFASSEPRIHTRPQTHSGEGETRPAFLGNTRAMAERASAETPDGPERFIAGPYALPSPLERCAFPLTSEQRECMNNLAFIDALDRDAILRMTGPRP